MPLRVETPRGAFPVLGLSGREALSEPFRFRVELVAENASPLPLDELIGAPATVSLEEGRSARRFSGICESATQGERDARFTTYELELVPQLWLLTRKAGSRAFQQLSVPEILERVFFESDSSIELRTPLHPREYVVQYRESDFAFVSRLLEDEGIYYFFRHGERSHELVVADSPAAHPELPTVQFDPQGRPGTVHAWERRHELRSGKVTLWDHNFQLPHPVEAEATGGNAAFELYDFPGGYAQRFDGVGAAGGDQPGELEKILQDAQRTAQIRMEAETAQAVVVTGASTVPELAAGHQFTLSGHPVADGKYVVTSVQHTAEAAAPGRPRVGYANQFTCIPAAVPYRPPRKTPRPAIPGVVTGVVVGPPGQEEFSDKYGRVKVQFHWDRAPAGADSSCWIRVSQQWAGAGEVVIPRVGEEVIVAFDHGDPDRPVIVGSVYNAEVPR